MWQAIKTFFSAPLAKAGALTVVKVWQVALAVTVVAGTVGTYTYIRLTTPNNTPQHVIVFIGGLNTSMTNCHEDTFDDDIHSEILAFLLSQAAGIANPYVKGCNGLDPNQSYVSARGSMIHSSYNGGAMDPHGFWKPNDYEPCSSVNSDTLAKDVQTFDAMLDAYRQTFPNAHFTIVGHSLGGLVGLQGAYDYVVNKGNSDIDKVVTIDSPLKGVQAGSSTGSILAHLEAKTCSLGGHSGSVVTADLMALGMTSINATHGDLKCDNPKDPRQAQLSWCKGQQLAQRGVGVVTLGNDQDSLFCGGLTQTGAGLDYRCYTQTLGTAHLVLSKIYDLTPLPTEGFAIAGLLDTAFGSGHFTLISTPARELEIIRYILAPVVMINQPTLQNSSLTSTAGTVLWLPARMRY